jgi:hypothetical protein
MRAAVAVVLAVFAVQAVMDSLIFQKRNSLWKATRTVVDHRYAR